MKILVKKANKYDGSDQYTTLGCINASIPFKGILESSGEKGYVGEGMDSFYEKFSHRMCAQNYCFGNSNTQSKYKCNLSFISEKAKIEKKNAAVTPNPTADESTMDSMEDQKNEMQSTMGPLEDQKNEMQSTESPSATENKPMADAPASKNEHKEPVPATKQSPKKTSENGKKSSASVTRFEVLAMLFLIVFTMLRLCIN